MTKNNLDAAFESKAQETSELNIWKGKDGQDVSILGTVINVGISGKFATPYVTLDVNGEEKIVFLSSGIINSFKFKNYINNEDDWTIKSEDELLNSQIAFKYVGEELNEKTKRKFSKYLILFEADLIKAGVIKKKV